MLPLECLLQPLLHPACYRYQMPPQPLSVQAHPSTFHVGALTRFQLAFVPPILCSRIWSCFRTVDTDVDTAALDT